MGFKTNYLLVDGWNISCITGLLFGRIRKLKSHFWCLQGIKEESCLDVIKGRRGFSFTTIGKKESLIYSEELGNNSAIFQGTFQKTLDDSW